MKFCVAAALLCLVACVTATQFTDCGSKSATVTKVEVSDCPDSEDTCVLKKGSTKHLTIEFQSQSEATKVQAVVHGVIKGVPLPFPLPQRDGCKSGLTCPLKSGQAYTYANDLEVKSAYPALSVTVRWELKDDKSSDIVCVEIPARIE